MNAFDSCLRDLEATSGLEVGGGVALTRSNRRKQSRRNGDNVDNNDNGIVDNPRNSPGEAGGRKCKLRYELVQDGI